jgi:hypothetical protein
LKDKTSVAGRELAIAIHDLCRDRIEATVPADDVVGALVRVLASITVGHDLGGTNVQTRLAEALAVARARKDAVAKMRVGQ